MLCGDLERYLEAFLDGRLGRGRAALLRRHLASCLVCRARVERQRQFERELRSAMRGLETGSSVWRGLELDYVAGPSGPILRLPEPSADGPAAPPERLPRPPRGRRHPLRSAARRAAGEHRLTSTLLGILLCAAAAGSVIELVTAMGYSRRMAEPPGAALADVERRLAHASDSVDDLEGWLALELGVLPPPRLPAPQGFTVLGGSVLDRGALVAYARDGNPFVLVIAPLGASGAEGWPEERHWMYELSWRDGAFDYELMSDASAASLAEFAESVGSVH